MYRAAIKILNILNDNGLEGYIVGGFVRDKLLGNTSEDIDITTNAKEEDLTKIFSNITLNNYGSYKLNYDGFIYEITTYRKDINSKNSRWPKEIKCVNTLKEDLLRRDFTINTLCIDKNENIIDLLDAKKDLDNKIMKVVGDPAIKIKEDALRILRAVRFCAVLDFTMDKELIEGIKQNKELLYEISFDRKKEELNKMFKSKNFNKGLKLIKELNLDNILEITYNDVIYSKSSLGIWAQINYSDKYNFYSSDKKVIDEVRYILNKKEIDNMSIYKFSKESIEISIELLKLNTTYDKLYNNLVIHSKKDIDITFDDIINIGITNDKINQIYIDLENKILYNKLKNEKEELIRYISDNYKER